MPGVKSRQFLYQTFTNAQNKTTDYTYDLEGNLTSIKDPAGRTPCRVWSRRESTSGLYLWRKWNRRTGKR
ncbi:RHS repeat domain-containing protein [Dorea longicatena]|uniref:RHS repeat domain-containing protein n=1 Tax=Dorea longicatena TaxID=88431 RepID=UPI0036F3AF85